VFIIGVLSECAPFLHESRLSTVVSKPIFSTCNDSWDTSFASTAKSTATKSKIPPNKDFVFGEMGRFEEVKADEDANGFHGRILRSAGFLGLRNLFSCYPYFGGC
jgi:hypothetical protein